MNSKKAAIAPRIVDERRRNKNMKRNEMQTLARAYIVSDASEFMSGSRIHVDQLQITLYTFMLSIYSEAAAHTYAHTRAAIGKRQSKRRERKKLHEKRIKH